ncbi:glycoside hydrolase family 15 protein, partial [Candidatus Pacearchaeota archaeon]
DKSHQIRDFYYPYVGQENHVSSKIHRIGIFEKNRLFWLSDPSWKLDIKYRKDSLVSDVRATNKELKLKLNINEAVHFNENIFLRKIVIENLDNRRRDLKLFIAQHFNISENNIGDTVFYDPRMNVLISYKGKRYLLIGGSIDGKNFEDYATGEAEVGGKIGTYKDAEDGVLSKNPIEHGSVDSVIGFSFSIGPKEKKTADYWICVGKKYREVCDLLNSIKNKSCKALIEETSKFWSNWVNKKLINFFDLDSRTKELFKRSLLIIRAQTDSHGAIIAANDTHVFRRKEDTYSYMWPRDGALISRSLDRIGQHEITDRFFKFCTSVLSSEGYLLHKYRPDGSLGSSWHPWVKGDKLQLPIQEDETALVLDALWKHFKSHQDKKKMREFYHKFVKKAADFLESFRDKDTKLPKESYDLWEEKLGVHTFTSSTVYAGLCAASKFAKEFGTKKDSKRYLLAAKEVKGAILKYLFDENSGTFIKGIRYEDGKIVRDLTVDISTLYGLFEYGIVDIDDSRLDKTAKLTVSKLWCESCGGLFRYENDMYYKIHSSNTPNPWFISTLWLAEYYIAKAKKISDLKKAKELIYWVKSKALPSGVLSEQVNPFNGNPLSVAPLTWSHAGFIIAVIKYCDKYKELKQKGLINKKTKNEK